MANRNNILSLTAAAFLLAAGSGAHAAMITELTNPSFETTSGTTVVGWGESAGGANSSIINPVATSVEPVTPFGNEQALLMHRTTTNTTDTWIFQSIGTVGAEDVGTELRLSLIAASRSTITGDGTSAMGGATGIVGFFIGVTDVAMGTNVGDQLASSVDASLDPGEGFHTLSDTITIGADLLGQELFVRISIHTNQPNGESDQYYFDNVQLDVIPEPSAALLMGIPALAVLLRRSRSSA